jgi:YVTN family beta-propeller protein
MWFTRALVPVALLTGLGSLPTHLTASRTASTDDFVHFESGHVHPAAMTPDGTKLVVVNTPDNRLSVFDLTGAVPVRIAEIPVGMEPVSVAVRNDGEAWVVNNLSDDVSIVNLVTCNVRATLHVGDEPTDVVFAGSADRAFVSVSQEDAVKVYDPANLAAAPVVIAIPARAPRALARSLDGSEVLVTVLHASGQSTVLAAAQAGDSLPEPVPAMDPSLPPRPGPGCWCGSTAPIGSTRQRTCGIRRFTTPCRPSRSFI